MRLVVLAILTAVFTPCVLVAGVGPLVVALAVAVGISAFA